MTSLRPQRGPHASESLQRPPLQALAQTYLGLIVEGDRTRALRLLVGEVEHGADPQTLLDEVVDPVRGTLRRLVDGGEVPPETARHLSAVDQLVRAMLVPPLFDDVPLA